jgi:hypothetical protein
MADPKKIAEENKSLKEQIQLLRDRNKLQEDSLDISSSVLDSLKEVLGIQSRSSTFEKATLKTNQDINTSILNQKTGLSDISTIQRQIQKNEDLLKKSKLIESGLLSSIGGKLSQNAKIIEGRIKKQATQQKQLSEYNKKIEEGVAIDIKSYNQLKQKISLQDDLISQGFQNLSSLEQQIILTQQNTKALEEQQEVRKGEKAIQTQLETQLGISGKIAKTLGAIPGVGAASAKALEEVTEELQAQVEAGGALPSRWKTFSMLIGKTAKSLSKGITDPVAILGYLSEADKGAGDLAKNMNLTYSEALNTRRELSGVAASSMDSAVNTRGLQESLMAVNDAIGARVSLNAKDLVTMTKMREQSGMSNEESLGLVKLSQINGKSLEQNNKTILGAAKIYAAKNKLAINEKQILKDVSGISASLKLSLGGSAEELARSAVQARQFGLNLEQAEKISSSLLQFESSIEDELSAELLTGKNLNFERARGLALNGDIAGATAEIAKQMGSAADFTNMNVIQQEALAKSVGMSREELAQSLTDQLALQKLGAKEGQSAQDRYNELKAQGLSQAQIQAKLGKDTNADLYEQQSIQERLNQSVEKLKDIFISIAEPVLSILTPLMDLVTTVLPGISFLMQGILIPIQLLADGFNELFTLSGGFTDHLVGALKLLGGIAGAYALVKTIQIASNRQAIIDGSLQKGKLATLIAQAAAWAVANPFTAIAGLAIAGTVAAGLYSMVKGDDIMSPGTGGGGYGSRTLFGPEGAIQLNNKDTVIAGTNLFDKSSKADDMVSAPKGALSVSNKTAVKKEVTQDSNAGTNARLDALIAMTGKVNTISTLKIQ